MGRLPLQLLLSITPAYLLGLCLHAVTLRLPSFPLLQHPTERQPAHLLVMARVHATVDLATLAAGLRVSQGQEHPSNFTSPVVLLYLARFQLPHLAMLLSRARLSAPPPGALQHSAPPAPH